MAYYRTLSLLNASLTVPLLVVGGTATVTFSVPGAQVGMAVVVNPNVTQAANTILPQLVANVTSANTVSVTASALVAIGATTLKLDIRVLP